MFLRNSLHIKRYKTVVNACCRLLNTQLERQPLMVNVLKQNPAEKKIVINDIESKLAGFFNNHSDLELDEVPEIKTSLVPKKFFTLKESRNIKYSFTVDDHVAEKVANIINRYITKKDFILEVNAGLGLITHYLLKSKAKELYLGQSEELMPSLQNLMACNKGRLNFLSPETNKKSIFCLINKLLKPEERGQKLKVVSLVHDSRFFSELCATVVKDCNWHYLDVDFYLIVRPQTRKNCFSDKYRKFASYVILNSLINSEMLSELPRESFLPWPKKSEASMFLYRITRNPRAFDLIQKEEYSDFYKFLKIVGRSKYNFVIPTLEHWSPGCGLELHKIGITTWTKVIDLTPKQACDLYNSFKLTPGYDNYKMVISNDHKGLVAETEENEDHKLENTEIFVEDAENIENIVEIT